MSALFDNQADHGHRDKIYGQSAAAAECARTAPVERMRTCVAGAVRLALGALGGMGHRRTT
jgi:hypothetical protein